MRKPIIGVMGPANATKQEIRLAFELGRLIAENGWVLLTGGRNLGVMDAASQGAKSAGGLVIGVLMSDEPHKISIGVDVPIITDMGSGRNNINVLSSQVVIACGKTSPGTLSEIALALKGGRPVMLLNRDPLTRKFLKKIGKEKLFLVETPEQAVNMVRKILKT